MSCAMTDCADHAIDVLTSDAVKEIVILGRRGPAQASFTNPELLELGELEQADVIVDPADVELDEASQAWLDSDEADKTSRENVRILREYAEREPTGKPKRIVLRFLTSPVELQGDERVERIVVERNRLEPRDDGSLAARPTGERETLECGLVLRSIGYKGIAIPEVPFDERRGTIPNVAGRVVDGEHHVTGEYVTGWIRRGPSGVIGTNKKDGQEAASSLLEDAEAGLLNAPGERRRHRGPARRARRRAHQLARMGADRRARAGPRRRDPATREAHPVRATARRRARREIRPDRCPRRGRVKVS